MRTLFQFKPGVSNLVVIDPWGNLRYSASGNLQQNEFTDLVNAIESIRLEATKAQPKASATP
jgi:predicted transcriptional regulator